MASTAYDVVINSVKARIKRGEEGSYRERTVRREIEQTLITQTGSLSQSSRSDRPALYQSDWSEGANWWKPIISTEGARAYHKSRGVDSWSEPGKIVPLNGLSSAGGVANTRPWVFALGAIYAISVEDDTNASFRDVYKWTPASNEFVRETTYHSGVDDGQYAAAGVYDSSDGYVYLITENNKITRFNPTTNADDENYITTGFTVAPGTNIFTQQGYVMFYDGNKLYAIDKAGPTANVVYNDGLGTDMLSSASNLTGTWESGGKYKEYALPLAISTPAGIYYVKNVRQNFSSVANVFRVDLDAAGNWIGNPIATLPTGMVALAITEHLGSIMINATPRGAQVLANVNTTTLPTCLYHITQGSLGALGYYQDRDQVDQWIHPFLGSAGHLLYIGGDGEVWVYDAVNGGLHVGHSVGAGSVGRPWDRYATALNSSGEPIILLTAAQGARYMWKQETVNAPTTVTNFGDDETSYALESNYIDANLPMETKELTKVAMMVDSGTTSQEWTLQVAVDDGAFTDRLVHSGAGNYAEAAITGVEGYLFRYKLIYQTKNTTKRALRAVLLTFTAGAMVKELEMILDGSEFLNLDNELLRPDDFEALLRTLAQEQSIIPVSINYIDHDQSVSTTTTSNFKLIEVEMIKDKPDEPMIRVVLREP